MPNLKTLRMKLGCQLNAKLMPLGLRIDTTARRRPAADFMRSYKQTLSRLRAESGGFEVIEALCYEAGTHTHSHIDFECEFAGRHIARLQPERLLDIGSYRTFIVGLLAGRRVTTVDVRSREPAAPTEEVVTCEAKRLAFPDGAFDAVVSLCSVEHFGLGRYGDEIDIHADTQAMTEMRRVLKPGGHLVLSTTITGGRPHIAFNAHRVYDRAMIDRLRGGLVVEDESAFSVASGRPCAVSEVTKATGAYDVYCGCWRKGQD